MSHPSCFLALMSGTPNHTFTMSAYLHERLEPFTMINDLSSVTASHTALAYLRSSSSSDHIIRPPPVITKDVHTAKKPRDIELDHIQWGQRLDGPEYSDTPNPTELEENSRSNSPVHIRAREVSAITLPTIKNPPMNRWRIPVLCLAFFVQGLNDSAPGALLPYMQSHYKIEYAIESLIFVGNAVGFIVAAPFCHTLNDRFGRAKVLSACTLLNSLAYLAIVCQPPWPVVVIAFLLLGMLFSPH